jgi:small neutral amino acid transporter SnatA (MarC family)
MIKLFLENFVLLFIAIDPISLLPIFASFTQGLNRKDIITLCLRTGTTAFLILLIFWGVFPKLGVNTYTIPYLTLMYDGRQFD